MSDKKTNIIAAILLSLMFLSAFFSYVGDSLTMDELSHIPAGYSYLSQGDFRINPEHPPLIKDLAALPLLTMDIEFPSESEAWNNEINSQWTYGWELLFNSGNDADTMIFWARLPVVIVLIPLGWFLFYWTKKEIGNKVALLTLFLFSFSPTFLAHGRLVTTDVGATLGILLSIYFWLKYLKNPTKKNVILAGLIFGLSMLLKYSVVLVIPLFAIITVIYSILNKKNILRYLTLAALIGIIGVVFVILPVYILHVRNYPVEKQLSDTASILASSPLKAMSGLVISTLIAILFATFFTKDYFWVDTFYRMKRCISENFTQFTMALLLIIYWGTSITGNLNIGVRHILPVFPLTYVLISISLISGIEKIKNPSFKKGWMALLGILMAWYAISSVGSFPHYLSYFNEIAGGSDNGYLYVVDSNYDWGQDLKRLAAWVDENNIDKIKTDYFGGADVKYYLGDKWESLDRLRRPKGYLAISATHLQGGKGDPAHGFDQPILYYKWLNNYEPVARAGKSIFIYYIK